MNDRYVDLRRHFLLVAAFLIVLVAFSEVIAYFAMWQDGTSWESYSALYFWTPTIILVVGYALLWFVLESPDFSGRRKNLCTAGYMILMCMVIAVFPCDTPAAYTCFCVPVIWVTVFGDKELCRLTHIAAQVCMLFLLLLSSVMEKIDSTFFIFNVAIAMILVAASRVLSVLLLQFIEKNDDILKLHEEDNVSLEKKLLREPMTGLYNHTAFYDYLDRHVKNRDMEPLSLAVVDIDNFKKVNDTYGHGNGDEVIHRLAELLQKHCGEHAYVSRYGGEEFAIIFPYTKVKDAHKIMDGVLEKFRAERFDWHPGSITFSCGLFQLSAYQMTTEEFFEVTDRMLYRAKQNGKNQCCSG